MTKPLYSLTHQDIYNIARDSLDSACLTVQHSLFNDSQGDFANGFFTGENFDVIHTILVKYIKGEISNHILNKETKEEFDYNKYYPTANQFKTEDILRITNQYFENGINTKEDMLEFARMCWAECAIHMETKKGVNYD